MLILHLYACVWYLGPLNGVNYTNNEARGDKLLFIKTI